MSDPRILTPEQLAAIRAAASDGLVAMAVDALLRHIEAFTEQAAETIERLESRCRDADVARRIAEWDLGAARADVLRLTEQAAADRAVIEAAEKLVGLKREAEKAFPAGFDSIPGLLRTSGAHAMLARRISEAGKALLRAVNDRRGRSS